MFVLLLHALALLAGVAASDDVMPRDVFPGIGEHMYVGVALNWSEALLGCQANASHLLVIDSDAEAAAIKQMMVKYSAPFIHLGFSDQWKAGKYNTIYGEPISAACNSDQQLAPGSPRGGATFNCGGFSNAGFTDTSCADKQVFICELDQPSTGGELLGYDLIPEFGYYKYTAVNTTWVDADEACREDGTQLVVLNSQVEADALRRHYNLVQPFSYHTGVHRYYGGNDNFRTVTGKLLTATGYTRWYNNGAEPYLNFITRPFTFYHEKTYSIYGLATVDTGIFPFICERALT